MASFQALAAWQQYLLAAYGIVVLLAISRHFICSYEMRRIRFLRPDDPKLTSRKRPFVSIMVPAKDEAATIEACVRSLLAQDYDDFEILVADDRSEDETAAIVERIARRESRVSLIQIVNLPAGWTGKTHALHDCQQYARGDWFLFVDADMVLDPSCLSVALRDCMDHNADMESLLPSLESKSFWERVVQPFAGTCLLILFPLSKVNDRSRRDFGFANGQFILIRREAYEDIGGHAAVRDKFVEDIHLGRNLRRQGRDLRVVVASDLARVRMYSSLSAIVRGWSRILYSAVDHRPGKLVLLFTFICMLSVLPYGVILGNGLALLNGSTSLFVKLGLALGVLHEFVQLTLYARTYRTARADMRYLALRWLAVFTMLYILIRTIRMCRTHKVTWRGTTYDKELQRAA